MKRNVFISYDCPTAPFRSHDVTVELKPGKQGPELTILSAGVAAVRSLPVRILSAKDATSALSAQGVPPILHFPNNTRHPAGSEAAISWYNDRGEGWIRLIQPNRLVALLDLQGWAIPEAAKAIPVRGKRGPPKSMDLWVAIAALLSPTLFDGAHLEAATGINRFNVYDWLKRATDAGLITALRGGRRSCFQITPEQAISVAEFIRSSWKEWRISANRSCVCSTH